MTGRWALAAASVAAAIGLSVPASATSPARSDSSLRQARTALVSSWGYRATRRRTGKHFPSTRIAAALRGIDRALAAQEPPTVAGPLDQPYVFHVAGADVPDFARLAAAGWKDVLFQDEDTRLESLMASARAHGLMAGLWHVPRTDNAAAFAQKVMADDARLRPDVEAVDVELIGKGVPGSLGWLWNEAFAAAFRPVVPSAVSVLPFQDDFDYGAYTRLGLHVWPQAYGAQLYEHYDPETVAQRVAANGVPRSVIEPTIAAGQGVTARPAGGYGIYRSDYMTEEDYRP